MARPKTPAGRKSGQIIGRGRNKWLVRVYLGTSTEGARQYVSKIVLGSFKQAQTFLGTQLSSLEQQTFVPPAKQNVHEFLRSWLELDKGPADFGRLCSHALTGYEQFAIREMCRHVVGLQAVIYDGFIAPPQPVESLEEQVRRRSKETLGVTLDVRLKKHDLSQRIPELERASDGF